MGEVSGKQIADYQKLIQDQKIGTPNLLGRIGDALTYGTRGVTTSLPIIGKYLGTSGITDQDLLEKLQDARTGWGGFGMTVPGTKGLGVVPLDVMHELQQEQAKRDRIRSEVVSVVNNMSTDISQTTDLKEQAGKFEAAKISLSPYGSFNDQGDFIFKGKLAQPSMASYSISNVPGQPLKFGAQAFLPAYPTEVMLGMEKKPVWQQNILKGLAMVGSGAETALEFRGLSGTGEIIKTGVKGLPIGLGAVEKGLTKFGEKVGLDVAATKVNRAIESLQKGITETVKLQEGAIKLGIRGGETIKPAIITEKVSDAAIESIRKLASATPKFFKTAESQAETFNRAILGASAKEIGSGIKTGAITAAETVARPFNVAGRTIASGMNYAGRGIGTGIDYLGQGMKTAGSAIVTAGEAAARPIASAVSRTMELAQAGVKTIDQGLTLAKEGVLTGVEKGRVFATEYLGKAEAQAGKFNEVILYKPARTTGEVITSGVKATKSFAIDLGERAIAGTPGQIYRGTVEELKAARIALKEAGQTVKLVAKKVGEKTYEWTIESTIKGVQVAKAFAIDYLGKVESQAGKFNEAILYKPARILGKGAGKIGGATENIFIRSPFEMGQQARKVTNALVKGLGRVAKEDIYRPVIKAIKAHPEAIKYGGIGLLGSGLVQDAQAYAQQSYQKYGGLGREALVKGLEFVPTTAPTIFAYDLAGKFIKTAPKIFDIPELSISKTTAQNIKKGIVGANILGTGVGTYQMVTGKDVFAPGVRTGLAYATGLSNPILGGLFLGTVQAEKQIKEKRAMSDVDKQLLLKGYATTVGEGLLSGAAFDAVWKAGELLGPIVSKTIETDLATGRIGRVLASTEVGRRVAPWAILAPEVAGKVISRGSQTMFIGQSIGTTAGAGYDWFSGQKRLAKEEFAGLGASLVGTKVGEFAAAGGIAFGAAMTRPFAIAQSEGTEAGSFKTKPISRQAEELLSRRKLKADRTQIYIDMKKPSIDVYGDRKSVV